VGKKIGKILDYLQQKVKMAEKTPTVMKVKIHQFNYVTVILMIAVFVILHQVKTSLKLIKIQNGMQYLENQEKSRHKVTIPGNQIHLLQNQVQKAVPKLLAELAAAEAVMTDNQEEVQAVVVHLAMAHQAAVAVVEVAVQVHHQVLLLDIQVVAAK
jgi:hypothetical protein